MRIKFFSILVGLFFLVAGIASAEVFHSGDGWSTDDMLVNPFKITEEWTQLKITPCPGGAPHLHVLMKSKDPNRVPQAIEVSITPPNQSGHTSLLTVAYYQNGVVKVFGSDPDSKKYIFIKDIPVNRNPFVPPNQQPPPAPAQPAPNDDGMS